MQFSHNDNEQGGQIKKRLRMPLFIRLSLVVFLFFGLTCGTIAFYFSENLKPVFLAENLKSGEQILGFLASSAKIPILAGDALRLKGLVRGASDIDGVAYAYVVDRNQSVQAYYGEDEFGEKRDPLETREVVGETTNSQIVLNVGPSGERVYDLSRVVLYNQKPLGTVHLGLSGKFIDKSFFAARRSLLESLFVPLLCLGLILLVIVYIYSLRTKRRIGRILVAVREYGNGNLQYRVEDLGNNELGDVALALHTTSQKLSSRSTSQQQLEEYLKFSSFDRILEMPISKGESYAMRKQVAVLFAGIKGFGAYTAGTEKPEEIVSALNKYIGVATKVISKHGGYVDKLIGDAFVGIFGVSPYRGNHTARAVRAALDLQGALAVGSINKSRFLSSVCIGISSGIVLSGNIGSHSKVEYSSIGETIKEAYWLTSLGHAGEIILGEEMYSQIKDSVRVEPLPPRHVFGGPDVIKSFRLLKLTENENEN